MAKEHILFDKTELMAMAYMGNIAQMVNLKYNNITGISIKPIMEKSGFSKKPSEIIEIKVNNMPVPLTYTMLKEKQFWDSYKTNLKKFAKNNRITLIDET